MMHRAMTTAAAVAALALAACGGDGDRQTAASGGAPDPDNVVARVDGEPISEVELDAQVQAMSRRGQRVDRGQALDQLIDMKILTNQAEKDGLPRQPEIAAAIERQRASLLANHLLRSKMAEFDVSEDELRKAYEDRVSDLEQTKEYKASHILLEEKAKANSMIEQLDGGAEFAELAKEHSTGPTASRGGNLGWFTADDMVAPFTEAVQGLEPGSYTGEPVKTQYGWHVVRLDDTRKAEKPEFEDMKQRLRNEMLSQRIRDYIAGLRDEVEVEITAEDLEGNATGDDAEAAAEAGTEPEAGSAESGTDGDDGSPDSGADQGSSGGY